jgi:hypothetical protein
MSLSSGSKGGGHPQDLLLVVVDVRSVESMARSQNIKIYKKEISWGRNLVLSCVVKKNILEFMLAFV